MALGNSSIKSVRTAYDNILKDINYGNTDSEGLYSCFNTFQYVAKSLSEWADDTVIGQNTKNDLTALTNSLTDLIEESRRLLGKIELFCTKQFNLNGNNKNFVTGVTFKKY